MMAWPPRCQTTHPDPESFEPQARRDHQSWLQYQSPCNAGHAPENNTKLEEMRLRWSMQVMWETLTCAWQGEVCGYSLHDEALLCGPPPPSLPELIMQVKSESVPWWDTRGFINLVRPYAYHVSRLALSSYDWQMRRKSGLPFSFTRFSEHIEDVKHLHFLLSVAQARFVMTYSSVATKFQRSGNMPGPSGCPYQGHTPLSNMGRHMLNSMRSALGSVNIAILEDLQERVREANIVSGPTDPDIPMLELILCTLTRALMPYGMYIMRNALNGTYMAWLTQLGNEPFLFWCHFLLNATPVEDGGDAFTRSEKLVCLETMSEIIAVISWSWPGAFEHPLRGEIARTIEEIKFAQALSETLGIETLRLDSRSMFSNQSGSTESPNELYMFPAVLELPDIEAAMRDAGVMDMINGAQLEANSEYARWAATITPFTISSQETFLDGGVRSISSATAVDHGGTIGLPNNDDIGHGDGRRATSTFTPRPTGMQTQTPMAGIPVNTNRVPTQGYVYDADTSVWDAMGVHIGAATGQTDAWTMDTGDFDTSTDDSLWDLMVPADQPRFSCL
ncbi:hypothetical protein CONPUDRAFT_168672 [Coniophora puteana RWD-64-598 SS2]|uniref:Uncharacterized protein n=1 Tax=Coniophora puteana (strain RWD-64-598) TaxID=741705 RepID=A0A5M3MCM0_CONPW|nr:uncharacterized protein CONPUDRAFT_168672 [Coniophora puteana RWD-64-598 SS2]EIW76958.1 hypothetical protein CONPUDRAFT_168672 [Coniophora puteana RWD-64-598 SS2]